MRQAIRNFMVGPDGIAGVALIEFTIFLPIVVVMSIYTMDFGLLIWRKMEVQHAAQAGAQYAMVHGYSSPPSSISSAVTNATTAFTISASPAPNQFCGCPTSTGVTQIAAGSCASGSNCSGSVAGTYVTVSAQATSYKSLTPYGLVPSSWGNLTAQSTVRIQ
jgi:Flp pilus assembly protein TadG